ncbi:MAG: hypothetical protein AB7G25_03430 [Sphingomonadaceae bacterium]
MFGCSTDALVSVGCGEAKTCAQLLHEPLPRCLLAARDWKQSDKRQRPKPRTISLDPELEPIDPHRLKRDHFCTLAGIEGDDRDTFYRFLLEEAESFRSWTVQATFEASRAEERAANVGLAEVAEKLIAAIEALDGDDYAQLTARTPLLPAMPLENKGLWLQEVAYTVHQVAHQLSILPSCSKALSKVARSAGATSVLFGALSNGRSYVPQHLPGQSARANIGYNDPVAALIDALSHIRTGLVSIADAQAAIKGPGPNGNLRQFILWVDDIVRHFRATPFKPGTGYDRYFKESSISPDDRFVEELLKMIFDSVPLCIQKLRPLLYSAHAGLEALKLHAADRNARDIPLRDISQVTNAPAPM